jgi:hypothetical protein
MRQGCKLAGDNDHHDCSFVLVLYLCFIEYRGDPMKEAMKSVLRPVIRRIRLHADVNSYANSQRMPGE